MIRPALFLDRDGVLLKVKRDEYVLSKEQIDWIDGSLEALGRLRIMSVPIIVVTNQQCVGFGLISRPDLEEIHAEIRRQADNTIDAFYYCPHKKSDNCHCRKPQIGLFEMAAREWNIDLSKSVYVGDTIGDVLAARIAHIYPVWVRSGLEEIPPVPMVCSSSIFNNLLDAVPFLEQYLSSQFVE
jgi:D-glycero-D-manno-heptose 1,7-bisphosphate phosphatase